MDKITDDERIKFAVYCWPICVPIGLVVKLWVRVGFWLYRKLLPEILEDSPTPPKPIKQKICVSTKQQ